MPLIQWIMQNLQKKIPVGVEIGGEAEKRTIYNVLSAGGGVVLNGTAIEMLMPGFEGVVVSGQATISKLVFLFGLGGAKLSGTGLIQTGFVNRKRVDYGIGDTVIYCRQKFVVIGVKISFEPIYLCKNNQGIVKLPQSQLSACVNTNINDILAQLACLETDLTQTPEPPTVPVVEYVYKMPIAQPCENKQSSKMTIERILKNLERLGVEV